MMTPADPQSHQDASLVCAEKTSPRSHTPPDPDEEEQGTINSYNVHT